MATQKKADKAARYRIARAFRHGGVYYSDDARIADLPAAEVERRVERGFLVERRPPRAEPAPAPAAKAKE